MYICVIFLARTLLDSNPSEYRITYTDKGPGRKELSDAEKTQQAVVHVQEICHLSNESIVGHHHGDGSEQGLQVVR